MSVGYTFVCLQEKEIYYASSCLEARYWMPFFAHIYQGHPVVIFNDLMWESLEDVYRTKSSCGEYNECAICYDAFDGKVLDKILMSEAEFDEIFEQIGGKRINNLEDYIRYKYRPVETK